MKSTKILLLCVASLAATHAFQTSLHHIQLVKNAKVLDRSINSFQKSHFTTNMQTLVTLKATEDSQVSCEKKKGLMDNIWNDKTKIVAYLAVWYLGNIYYNIYNKKACIALGSNAAGHANAHWTLAAVQLLVGALVVLPLWMTGLRPAPNMSLDNWKELFPVGVWAAMAHAFSVIALGAGAVSFTQIIKAAEPVFAAATNAIVLKDIDHPMVYAALLPIIAGVGLASLKELSFTWTALIFAALSNQAAANKNVVSKGVMSKPWAKALGPQNTYAVITILALLATIPLVLLFDAKDPARVYADVLQRGAAGDVLKYSFLSGLVFYVYNEASFQALEKLSPVTHSVANTIKRVVIIIASCMVFHTPMSLLGGIGSGVAVAGTLLYSLAKKAYAKHPEKHSAVVSPSIDSADAVADESSTNATPAIATTAATKEEDVQSHQT